MTQSCLKMIRFNHLGHKFERRILILRRHIRLLLKRIIHCSSGKPRSYLILSSAPSLPAASVSSGSNFSSGAITPMPKPTLDLDGVISDSDLVSLKISLLGDPSIGKTSFSAKYVGNESEQGVDDSGNNFMDKTLCVKGARISYSIWEVEGKERSKDQIQTACKDSVAILFMFDLTSRCTLNGIITWYQEAMKSNQNAIPILVGTKFDEFIQLPLDLQWTIANQARAYAKALNATLFFSSASYNINVNKIFKFITAKLFDLPWTVERNLNIGEPMIDF